MVTKCICFDIPFDKMKETAANNRCKTVEDLQRYLPFGQQCKLCHPYVERMLKTGKTKFDVIE